MSEKEKPSFAEPRISIRGNRVGFLLSHGLGGTPLELAYVAQGLGRAGYSVECCKLAGHCGSAEDLRTATWPQWVESYEAAHDALMNRCDIIIAGGLSMGGVLGMNLALSRRGQVHGLALFAPTLRLDGWAIPWYARILNYIRPTPLRIEFDLAERAPYGIKDERVRSFVVKSMLSGDTSKAGVFSTPLRAFANFNQLVASVRPRLGEIDLPALIVHPREDDMSSLQNSLYLQRKLGGVVDMVVLNDSYHLVTLDRQRHIVIDRAISFAQRLEASLVESGVVAKIAGMAPQRSSEAPRA